MADDIRQKIASFEQQRQTLMAVSMQKQQLEASVNGLTRSLEEIEKTSESTVFKAAGPILVQRDKNEVKKELEDLKETQSLRLKTMEKQEKSLVDKLNVLRTEIEANVPMPTSSAPSRKSGENTIVKSSKKE